MKVGFDPKIGAYYNKKTSNTNQSNKDKSAITFEKNSFMSSIEKKLNKVSDVDFIWKVCSLVLIGMQLAVIFSILYNQKKFDEADKAASEIINNQTSQRTLRTRTLDVDM